MVRSQGFHDAIAETLAAYVPDGVPCRGAALAVIEEMTNDLVSTFSASTALVVWSVPVDGHKHNARELPPLGPDDRDALELEEATAAARVRLFEIAWQALAGTGMDPGARFLLALERSCQAKVRRPGVLLTAYRWGLLDADPTTRNALVRFVRLFAPSKGESYADD
jgi:hypothetical protein